MIQERGGTPEKCGTCRYLEYDNGASDFVCGNPDSFDNYACFVNEEYTCDDWEEEG